jgi:hypothetical protein
LRATKFRTENRAAFKKCSTHIRSTMGLSPSLGRWKYRGDFLGFAFVASVVIVGAYRKDDQRGRAW